MRKLAYRLVWTTAFIIFVVGIAVQSLPSYADNVEAACVAAGHDGYIAIDGSGYCWTLSPDGIPMLTGRIK